MESCVPSPDPRNARHGHGPGGQSGAAGGLDYRTLFEAIPTPALVVAPPEWIIVEANAARLELTGSKRDEIVGRKLFDAFPDDPEQPDADGVRNLSRSLERAVATRRPDVMPVQHYPVRDSAGRFVERWWSPVNTPVIGPDGEVTLVIHCVEEVTELMRSRGEMAASETLAREQQAIIARLSEAESALRASEEFNRRVLASSADCIKVLDLDARLEFMSEGGMCVMEVDDFSTACGAYWPSFWSGEEHAKALAAVEEAKRGGNARFQGFAPTMKGSPRWWDVAVTPINGPDGKPEKLLSVSRDITAMRATETALGASEARLSAIFAQASAGFALTDLHGRFTEVNERYCEMLGRSREELLAMRMQDLTHSADVGGNLSLFAAAAAGGPPFDIEKRYVRPDGSELWVRNSVVGVRDSGGGVVAILAVSIDITDRKYAEARLRELNDTLEQEVAIRTAERDRMWETSPDLMLVIDFDGTFRRVNPAWTKLLGYAPEELVGHHVNEFVLAEDHGETTEAYESAATGSRPAVVNRYRHKDGSVRWISWVAAPAGGVTYATGRDITLEKEREAELAQAQEALRQSQKMEAMGSLTGGVAHDFNNLLTPIIGSLDMLMRRGVGSERERRLIDGALQSAERAKTLVQRLLAFARRQPLQPIAVDVARLVEGMTGLIGSTLGPKIDVRLDVASGLPPAKADLNQLEMALLNLAVNARDAMPDGGVLTVRARRESVRGPHRSSLPTGHYVLLQVADTGIGMDQATRERAIEPFFSTKGIGKGTGLGLSMVHGLAAQLGGRLLIDSTPGEGTTIELWLPISNKALGSQDDALDAPVARVGRGLALLVDDEELVRMSTADMLIDLGFEVVEANSAEDALGLISAGAAPDLLVTDHLMPGMSGTELARQARALNPTLPVLVVSGYAEVDGIASDLPRLTKPFRNAELAASLAALLPEAAD